MTGGRSSCHHTGLECGDRSRRFYLRAAAGTHVRSSTPIAVGAPVKAVTAVTALQTGGACCVISLLPGHNARVCGIAGVWQRGGGAEEELRARAAGMSGAL